MHTNSHTKLDVSTAVLLDLLSVKQAPAARSAGSQRAPAAHWVRFTEEENVRLHKAAAERNTKIQTFCHNAVMLKILEIEGVRKTEEEELELRETKRAVAIATATANASTTASKSTGLGIREHLAVNSSKNAKTAKSSPSPTPAAPTIIVQTNGTAGNENNANVKHFAVYVTKGPKWSREERLREAIKVLTTGADTKTEKQQLAIALDKAIEEIDAKAKGTAPKSTSALAWLKNVIT